MVAKILISESPEEREREIIRLLSTVSLKPNHPDVLLIGKEEKLGVEQAKKIKQFFAIKPYSSKGRVVVLEEGGGLTNEAQNAMLKTIEELPAESLLIIGSKSESVFLPTILSRCEIIRLQVTGDRGPKIWYSEEIKNLLGSSIEERFEYLDKLKERDELLSALITYFHKNLASHMTSGNTKFLKELLQAEQWAKQNVNIRAILEYLMLEMPETR